MSYYKVTLHCPKVLAHEPTFYLSSGNPPCSRPDFHIRTLSPSNSTRTSPSSGQILVKVLSAYILSYARSVFNGPRSYPLMTPLAPGYSAIGRVEDISPDVVSLPLGQLVLCDPMVRARDDTEVAILIGFNSGFNPLARKLSQGGIANRIVRRILSLPGREHLCSQ